MLSSSRERISIHIGGSETHQPIKEYTSGIKAPKDLILDNRGFMEVLLYRSGEDYSS